MLNSRHTHIHAKQRRSGKQDSGIYSHPSTKMTKLAKCEFLRKILDLAPVVFIFLIEHKPPPFGGKINGAQIDPVPTWCLDMHILANGLLK